jgi:hypothetical protein
MTFDFIHIGLGKCMSTTLQTQWARSSNYRFEAGNEIARTCEDLVEQHADNPAGLPGINLNVGRGPGDVSVLSAETFSFSFKNKPQLSEHIPTKQRYVAQTVGHLSNKALIVVRDPIQWVHSAHAQSINQGGFEGRQAFVESHRSVLLNNLHMGHLIETWQQHGLEVTVLPMEGFIQAPDQFWQNYESSLSVAVPNYQAEITGVSRNASRYDHLELAAIINRTQHKLSELVEKSESPDEEDKAVVLNALSLAQKWGSRRALHTANEAEVDALQGLFNPSCFGDFQQLTLDPSFIEHLEEHFVGPLEQFPAMQPYLDGYRASLNAVR